MSDQQNLRTIYNDLLDKTNDREIKPIIADLNNICQEPHTPHALNWQNLRMLYMQQTTRKPALVANFRASGLPWWHILSRKAVFIPIISCFLLLTSAFAFAATPLLQSLLQGDSTNSKVAINYKTFKTIHLSQKIGNATVTLEKGYVDKNIVVLGVTASPVSKEAHLDNMQLLQDGKTIATEDGGVSEVQGQTLSQSITFANIAVVGNSDTLHLTLKANLQDGTTSGIATFNFTLPYEHVEILTPNQQVTSNGQSITLKQITIGKTETAVVFLGLSATTTSKPKTAADIVFPQINMQVPGAGHLNFASAGPDEFNGPFTFHFKNDLSKLHGSWTITITQRNHTWIFHIHV